MFQKERGVMEMHTNITKTKIKVSDLVENYIYPFVRFLSRGNSVPKISF